MLILGQPAPTQVLKPERELLLELQVQAPRKRSVLSVQRPPLHLGIRCPAHILQLGKDNVPPFVY